MDSDSSFVGPEGVYSLTEEHKPSLLHSTFAPAAGLQQPGTATRASTVLVHFPPPKASTSQGFSLLGGSKSDKKDQRRALNASTAVPSTSTGLVQPHQDKDESVSGSDNAGDDPNAANNIDYHPQSGDPSDHHPIPVSPLPTTLFSPQIGNTSSKKKSTRAKANLRTTTSSFVTRVHTIEGLSKHLSSKTGDVSFIFYNSVKTFYWAETDAKSKEPLGRFTFSAWPTCHDVNQATASSTCIDIIIGFHTGDLLWFDPISMRYARLNKAGCITASPCTAVRWVPGSSNLFLVSHANGTIIVYDRDRDDSLFQPNPVPVSSSSSSNNGMSNSILTSSSGPSGKHTAEDSNGIVQPHSAEATSMTAAESSSSTSNSSSSQPSFHAQGVKTVNGQEPWDPLENIFVTRPGVWLNDSSNPMEFASEKERLEKEKENSIAATKNPVSHWRISKKSVFDFAFSPDVRYVAVVGEDGVLRVIDALSEKLVDSYAAYFGALSCVAWSPDGRFIITGGQDDLVTIFAPFEQRVVARCQGHTSFVSAVAWDPLRCDGRTYRFTSVGEDCKIILWDFSSGSLHRPKLQAAHHRSSISSQYSLVLKSRMGGDPSLAHIPNMALSKHHVAPSRSEVAILQPVLVKNVTGDILTDICVLPIALLTVSRAGTIKVWSRPPPPVRSSKNGKSKKLDGLYSAPGSIRVAG
ncbi:hypothetical protein FRC02_009660 [Tulasnella sp. 418]|nr:hypothetical protein FRC02_009660 [Tulasnella sp. 418]